ncbi:MAG: NAD(P)-dependent glycerol-3-phosphate dehydrogenase [Deltaproteobacteria bacterium]|nr:NAD(P)-dependent glycerol-3-phosphate dehydrogenase [Deltaproteobacteria bacterium]
MKADIAVIGAGSWGTTLANHLACKGGGVKLWVREEEVLLEIQELGENKTFLPGIKLSENLYPTNSLSEALEGASLVISAVPSHAIRGVFAKASPFIEKDATIVSISKGIEQGSFLTASGILKEVLPKDLNLNISVLSGPSFANEVSRRLPAAVSVAADNVEVASRVQKAFSTPELRVYINKDIIGVEYGGALKNVMAIASGISDGLMLGFNARAALITRGLIEVSRIGVAKGALQETFYGLSGLGDLVLTCTGTLSRNYTVGKELGKGRTLDEILGSMKMVAEGVKTSLAVRDLARSLGIEAPITEEVCSVLFDDKTPKEAVLNLMTRELKAE